MTQLNTTDLSIGYEKKIVVNDITVEIPKGQITSLIGPNGSGKSTFLKALARILEPAKGEVFIDGYESSCAKDCFFVTNEQSNQWIDC